MAEHVLEVTDDSFDTDVIQSDVPVLVDFWAPWCGPCRAVAPMLEELAGEYGGRVKIAKVNVDSNPKVSTSYQIRSIPSLILIKNGQVVGQLMGAVPKGRLVELIEKAM